MNNPEIPCSCTTCYNCQVAKDRDARVDTVSKEEKAAEASKAPVIAAQKYRESINSAGIVDPAEAMVCDSCQ